MVGVMIKKYQVHG